MADTPAEIIIRIPRLRIMAARIAMEPIAWAYAVGALSEARLDAMIKSLAAWVARGVDLSDA